MGAVQDNVGAGFGLALGISHQFGITPGHQRVVRPPYIVGPYHHGLVGPALLKMR